MVDKEMLSAMSDLLDEKLHPVYDRLDTLEQDVSGLKEDMRYVKVVQLENNVIPRLSTMEECYVDTSRRYIAHIDQIEFMDGDVIWLKNVVSNHSEQLRRLQG